MDHGMRQQLRFACAGDTLVGTLDRPAAAGGASIGLLIVSGGNEIRSGAHGGQAALAARVAAAGYPCFRFDRRGIGDSQGTNQGFLHSQQDIAAAAGMLRATCPGLDRVIGFGNCDAASALVLFGTEAGIDTLILANPWVIDDAVPAPPAVLPPAALRRRYWQRLADPGALKRLVSGKIALRDTARRALNAVLAPAAPPSALAVRIGAALARTAHPATILLARRDRTAIWFVDAWAGEAFALVRSREGTRVIERDTASHSFAGEGDADWLADAVLTVLAETAAG